MDFPSPENLSPMFVGREQELNTLAQKFIQEHNRVVVIAGMAGIGKTSLANMFANHYSDHFPGGVFFLNVTDLEKYHLESKSPQPSLLIINDLHQLNDSQVESKLEKILSHVPMARVLITSRRTIRIPSVEFQLELSPFTQAEMEELIYKISNYHYDRPTIEKFYALSKGHPLTTDLASSMLRDGIYTPRELFESLTPFIKPGLIGPDGLPLESNSRSYNIIINDVITVSDELLRKLSNNPKLLHELSPRLFEEVVAELLKRQGYDVKLTPITRDGGKDIYVASKNALGSFLYLVECKKYAPDNPIGVGFVRQLYGVVQAEKATAGILATTSFFTKDAIEFQKKVNYQLSLQDYLGIQKWLKSIKL